MNENLIEQLNHAAAPIEIAKGLPNHLYTDPAWLASEREKVFAPNWTCIGFESQVASQGYAVPVKFMDVPLLIVKDKDDVIRVFENVCRHRGMILVDKPRQLSTVITCPYHNWCYSLNGDLRGTPMVGGTDQNSHECVKREELGLNEVRSHIWLGCIFVNLDGNAPEFREYASELINLWHEYDGRSLFSTGADSEFQLEVNSNWKLAVENYTESYHLPWVHPGLNSYSPIEKHYHLIGKNYSGQGSKSYTPSLGEDGQSFPTFSDLSDKWNSGGEYAALYPNVLLGVHKDHVFAMMLEPIAYNRTIEHVAIYYTDESANEEQYGTMRSENAAQWKTVFEEDIFAVEGMQTGRGAPQFDGGKFSPVMDNPTHHFHKWIASEMLK